MTSPAALYAMISPADLRGSGPMAARPRERATEAERGAGSAAAAERSGAALDHRYGGIRQRIAASRLAGRACPRRVMRDSRPPTGLRQPREDRGR